MSSSKLTVEDIYTAEAWLKGLPDANDAKPRAVVDRLLKIGLEYVVSLPRIDWRILFSYALHRIVCRQSSTH